VLLTGATGFLGAFLLRDLLATTNWRVHCVVRADDADHGWRRILDTARGYGIETALDPTRVIAVPGDLAAEDMGVADVDALADTVQVVFHAAAHINFVLPYASVQATNVAGTRRIVDFAARGRVKPLHHMSTIAVFSPAEPDGVLTEESTPSAPEALGIGYTQTKWVAELLPVDFVARAVVALSREPAARGRTLHLFHPRGADFDTVYEGIRACGYPVRIVPADQWWALLEESAAEGNALAAAVPLFREGALELGDNTYRNEATEGLLRRLGLPFPAVDPAAVSRLVRFFEGVGELSAAVPVG
jgi:uncharacterized protein YbjT (DUF2867 family)